MVLSPNSGAIATWSSSGMTVPDAQLIMAQRFYSTFFRDPGQRLGDVIRIAKAGTTDLDIRHTWILLGDPTLKLR
jgi:hypothetical protein